MFKSLVLGALILLGCSTEPVHVQTVQEVVDRFVAATGGAEKWKSVQSLTVVSRSAPFSFDLYWKKPNRIRIEVPVEGPEPGLDIRAFDGTTGWRLSPLEGAEKARLMSGNEILDLIEMGDAQRELIDYKTKGHRHASRRGDFRGVHGRRHAHHLCHRGGRPDHLFRLRH